METILYIVGALVVGYLAGRAVSTWLYLASFVQILRDLNITDERIRKLAADMDIDMQDADRPATIIDMRVEQHDQQLFAYRKDTGAFMSQASDAATLIERLTQDARAIRMDVKYRIVDDDGAELLKDNPTH